MANAMPIGTDDGVVFGANGGVIGQKTNSEPRTLGQSRHQTRMSVLSRFQVRHHTT
jgi:hypothetical protein